MSFIRPTVRPRLGCYTKPKVNFNPYPETFLEKIIFNMHQKPAKPTPPPFVPIKDYDTYVDMLERRGMDEESAFELRMKHMEAMSVYQPPVPLVKKNSEPNILYPVMVFFKVEGDKVKVTLNTGMWNLYNNYHKKCKIPSFTAILKSRDWTQDEIEMLNKRHQKRKEMLVQLELDFERLFPETKTKVVKKPLKAVKKF